MVANIIAVLILAIPVVAQDFEPDRRPEEGLFLAMPINNGSFTAVSTSFTTAPTAGPSFPGQGVVPAGGGYYTVPYYNNNSAAPFSYADRAEWRTRPFTYSLWYRNTFTAFQQNTRLFGTGLWTGSADAGYVGIIDTGYSGAPYNKLTIHVDNGGNVTAWHSPEQSLGDWVWNHIVVTVDTSGSKAYLNGVLYSSVSGTFGTAATARTLYIGGANINSGGCDLDDIRVYAGRALTGEEVASLYHSGRSQQGDNQP